MNQPGVGWLMAWATRHPRTLIALLGAFLLCAGGGAVGYLNVRNLQRIELIQSRLGDAEQIRGLRHSLERSLLDEVREGSPAGSFLVQDVLLQVENALALESYLDPETARGLREIAEILSHPGVVTRGTLIRTLELAGSIQEAEARAQRNLLEDIQSDGRREFYTGIGVLAALAALISLTVWRLPKRLLNPLSGLRDRFAGLAEGHFQPIPVEGLEPDLLPLFRNYNAMVARMAELEGERRLRAQTLEDEVRSATRTLVAQQRTLADAQRLAAVGETAAGLAHELRNPLAGILASLENLRRESRNADTLRRAELLHSEAERVVRLLNDYLAAARHHPEPLQPTDLAKLVEELLALLRYQVPAGVTLKGDAAPGLICALPRDPIRQALMNLVWNSVEAMGSRPGTVGVTARKENSGVVVEVWDDGPGFPPELLGSRIQAFRTRRAGGTGLGLAMVQRTLQELGGSLTLANRDPTGASVRLFLPCAYKGEE